MECVVTESWPPEEYALFCLAQFSGTFVSQAKLTEEKQIFSN